MGTLVWGTAGTISGLQNNQQGNAIAAALAALSQGATPPSPASTGLASTAGLLWHDTTANQLKLRNQADTAWITLGQIDEANGLFLPVCQGGPLAGFMRGLLAGLTLSNDGTLPNTKIDVSVGDCADDTNSVLMSFAAGAIDCTTVGANGLDAGALGASTWYHAFAIGKPDGVTRAFLASTSLASPTLPTGYTLRRRIGSFKTDTNAHILPFSQDGDEFIWISAIQDYSTITLGATPATITLASVPPGVKVKALLRFSASNGSAITQVLLNSIDETSVAPNTPGGNISAFVASANQSVAAQISVRTNASQQIRAVANQASTIMNVITYGYQDTRGRLS